jgi:hypothetical protein
MSIEDPLPDPADDLPVDDDLEVEPPERLEVPLEADEADALEQVLEVPPPDTEE